jgi:hypothetical protein
MTTTAAVDWSIRYRQPHNCMVLKASLANEPRNARDYLFSIRRDSRFFSSVFCFRVVGVSDEYSLSNGLGW